jgi:hypothetical protein
VGGSSGLAALQGRIKELTRLVRAEHLGKGSVAQPAANNRQARLDGLVVI